MLNPADDLCTSDPMFKHTGERIAWKNPYKGTMMYSFVYTPDAEALRWDGAAPDSMAVGSRKGGFFYIGLRRVGKTLTKLPHSGAMGYRAKMLFTEDRAGGDSGNTEDVWTDCWLVVLTDEQLQRTYKC